MEDFSDKQEKLAQQQCTPCREGGTPLKAADILDYMEALNAGWKVIDNQRIERDFPFANFADALDFVNQIGRIAEEQKHHPNIYLAWGKVKVKLWTHAIDGLHENDFIIAARIDRLKEIESD